MTRFSSVHCDLNCFKLEPLEQKMIILGGGEHKLVVVRRTFAPLMCASDKWIMCLSLGLILFIVCVCVCFFSFLWRLASCCVFDCSCSCSDGPRPRRWAVSQLSVWKWWWKVEEESGQDAFPNECREKGECFPWRCRRLESRRFGAGCKRCRRNKVRKIGLQLWAGESNQSVLCLA